MSRKKRDIKENPKYTELFLAFFWHTKNYVLKSEKNGITTRAIKEDIEQLHDKIDNMRGKRTTLEAYSNRISRMLKAGLLVKTNETVSHKKIRYIVNKTWLINELFSIVHSGFKYQDIIRKARIDQRSYEYFQEDVLWAGIKNDCRSLYRIAEDIKFNNLNVFPLDRKEYRERINSTIFEIFESFICMNAFDLLESKKPITENEFLDQFRMDCIRYVAKKLVKKHLYLGNNSLYDAHMGDRNTEDHREYQAFLQDQDVN